MIRDAGLPPPPPPPFDSTMDGSPGSGSSHKKRKSFQRNARRVHFQAFVQFIPSAAPRDILEPAEWGSIWYRVDELRHFRDEARTVCRQMRLEENEKQQEQELGLHIPTNALNGGANRSDKQVRICSLRPADSMRRGLEQRACLERQRRRVLTIQFILQAQRLIRQTASLHGEKRLAHEARKSTKWAVDLAVEEGHRDYLRAYNSDYDFDEQLALAPANFESIFDIAAIVFDQTDENDLSLEPIDYSPGSRFKSNSQNDLPAQSTVTTCRLEQQVQYVNTQQQQQQQQQQQPSWDTEDINPIPFNEIEWVPNQQEATLVNLAELSLSCSQPLEFHTFQEFNQQSMNHYQEEDRRVRQRPSASPSTCLTRTTAATTQPAVINFPWTHATTPSPPFPVQEVRM